MNFVLSNNLGHICAVLPYPHTHYPPRTKKRLPLGSRFAPHIPNNCHRADGKIRWISTKSASSSAIVRCAMRMGFFLRKKNVVPSAAVTISRIPASVPVCRRSAPSAKMPWMITDATRISPKGLCTARSVFAMRVSAAFLPLKACLLISRSQNGIVITMIAARFTQPKMAYVIAFYPSISLPTTGRPCSLDKPCGEMVLISSVRSLPAVKPL